MERRDALKLLAGAAMLPLLSRDTLAFFREVHEQLPATSALKTLNPHQDVTITTIAELIIPQTNTPGAKAARGVGARREPAWALRVRDAGHARANAHHTYEDRLAVMFSRVGLGKSKLKLYE